MTIRVTPRQKHTMFVVLNTVSAICVLLILGLTVYNAYQANKRLTQGIDTLICMGLVPQDQRTIDTAKNCRKQAEAKSSATSSSSPAPTQTNTPTNTNPQSESSAHLNLPSQDPPTHKSSEPVTQVVDFVSRDVVQPVTHFIKGLLP